jgi:flagellar hook-basal body complex protein FliE
MSVDALAALAASAGTGPAAFLPPTPVAAPAGGFGAWFSHELDAVNAGLAASSADVRRLAAGQAPSLHEVMIHMEEAKLSFQLLAQVRNRLLDAYQEVMRMQV